MSKFPSKQRQQNIKRAMAYRPPPLYQCGACRLWYEFLTNGRCYACQPR
jgi:hypothetical protein